MRRPINPVIPYPHEAIQHTRCVLALSMITVALSLLKPEMLPQLGDLGKQVEKVDRWIERCSDGAQRRLSSGVLPGPIKRIPVSVPSDQLLCLPEPFTPLNGFSCNRTRNPCLREILRIRAMISKLWSLARLHSSKMGASSNWFGATSL